MSVLNTSNLDHTKAKMFLDPEELGMQRYDTLKYRAFDKLTDKQLGFFWRPEEVDILRDANDFKELSEHEQHIFTANLKRQIVLDSVQGRSPNLAFLPLVTIPELETWIETWAFSETIHSRSYTHIIRNIYPNPSKIFDEMMDIQEIVDCASSISKYYDELIEMTKWYELFGEGTHDVKSVGEAEYIDGQKISVPQTHKKRKIDLYNLKKQLYLCMASVNILEGVRFYVSFACSWAFAELKKMEGNAKIIKLIARDENVHLGSTQQILKLLTQDDSDFIKIAKECEKEVTQMFVEAVEQEKAWAEYLFKDGSMIGLNAKLLSDYIEWIGNKRIIAIGLKSPFSVPRANPLPWTQKWISGAEVQVAPQETEISSYIIGGTKQDVTSNSFKGFSL
jgi:ribonucleoside-diphosphate reductase beta chain|tara:strand:- start:1035 stop:2213 length:1179 start_codon:yes stop_codon:yes gene_type:complete